MGILSARSLTQALSQARHIGLVEEPFVIGDTSIVVRNLRPDQYDAIFKECQGLSDVEYLNTWQIAHVCRSICELNGQDLRDVQYVEDEEPDPKRNGQMKPVKLELHSWLRNNILNTWSREVIYIAYRKVTDAIEAAERQAQNGITFRVDEESAEDKFRRLLGELKEVEGDVPERILETVLKDNGYMRRATVEEIEAAEQKLAKVAEKIGQTSVPQEAPAKPQEALAPEAPKSSEPAPTAEQRTQAGPPTAERMAQLLRNRQPMNQQPEAPPVPQVAVQAPILASPPQPAPPAQAVPQASLGGRSAEHAALEGGFPDLPPGTPAPVNLQPQATVPEVRIGSGAKLDPNAAQAIIDTPPVGGINPRFRPPSR